MGIVFCKNSFIGELFWHIQIYEYLRASTAIKNIMLLVALYFNRFNFIFILTNPCFDNK